MPPKREVAPKPGSKKRGVVTSSSSSLGSVAGVKSSGVADVKSSGVVGVKSSAAGGLQNKIKQIQQTLLDNFNKLPNHVKLENDGLLKSIIAVNKGTTPKFIDSILKEITGLAASSSSTAVPNVPPADVMDDAPDDERLLVTDTDIAVSVTVNFLNAVGKLANLHKITRNKHNTCKSMFKTEFVCEDSGLELDRARRSFICSACNDKDILHAIKIMYSSSGGGGDDDDDDYTALDALLENPEDSFGALMVKDPFDDDTFDEAVPKDPYDVDEIWKRKPFKNHKLTFGTVRAILDALHDFWKGSRNTNDKEGYTIETRKKLLDMINKIIERHSGKNIKKFNTINDALIFLTDNNIVNCSDDYEANVVAFLYNYSGRNNDHPFKLKTVKTSDLHSQRDSFQGYRTTCSGVQLVFDNLDPDGLMADAAAEEIGSDVLRLLDWNSDSLNLFATFDAGSSHTKMIFESILRLRLFQTQANMFDSGNVQEIWSEIRKLVSSLAHEYMCDPSQFMTRLMMARSDQAILEGYPSLRFESAPTRFPNKGPHEFIVVFTIGDGLEVILEFTDGIKNGPSCAACEAATRFGVLADTHMNGNYPEISRVTCDLRNFKIRTPNGNLRDATPPEQGKINQMFKECAAGFGFKCYGDSEQSRQAHMQLQETFGDNWRCILASVDRISAMTGALRKNMAGFCSLNQAESLVILFPVQQSSIGVVDEFKLVCNDFRIFKEKLDSFIGVHEDLFGNIDKIKLYIAECIKYNNRGLEFFISKRHRAGIHVTSLVIDRLTNMVVMLEKFKNEVQTLNQHLSATAAAAADSDPLSILVGLLNTSQYANMIEEFLKYPDNFHIRNMVIRSMKQTIRSGNTNYMKALTLMETVFDITLFKKTSDDSVTTFLKDVSDKCHELQTANKFLAGFNHKSGTMKAYNGILCSQMKFMAVTYMSLYDAVNELERLCDSISARSRFGEFEKRYMPLKSIIEEKLIQLELNIRDNTDFEIDFENTRMSLVDCKNLLDMLCDEHQMHSEVAEDIVELVKKQKEYKLQRKKDDSEAAARAAADLDGENEDSPSSGSVRLASHAFPLDSVPSASSVKSQSGDNSEEDPPSKARVVSGAQPQTDKPLADRIKNSITKLKFIHGNKDVNLSEQIENLKTIIENPANMQAIIDAFKNVQKMFNNDSMTKGLTDNIALDCAQGILTHMTSEHLPPPPLLHLQSLRPVATAGGYKKNKQHKAVNQIGGAKITFGELNAGLNTNQKNKIFEDLFNIFSDVERSVMDKLFGILIKHEIIHEDDDLEISIIDLFIKLQDIAIHYNYQQEETMMKFMKDIDYILDDVIYLLWSRFIKLQDLASVYYNTAKSSDDPMYNVDDANPEISIFEILEIREHNNFTRLLFYLLHEFACWSRIQPEQEIPFSPPRSFQFSSSWSIEDDEITKKHIRDIGGTAAHALEHRGGVDFEDANAAPDIETEHFLNEFDEPHIEIIKNHVEELKQICTLLARLNGNSDDNLFKNYNSFFRKMIFLCLIICNANTTYGYDTNFSLGQDELDEKSIAHTKLYVRDYELITLDTPQQSRQTRMTISAQRELTKQILHNKFNGMIGMLSRITHQIRLKRQQIKEGHIQPQFEKTLDPVNFQKSRRFMVNQEILQKVKVKGGGCSTRKYTRKKVKSSKCSRNVKTRRTNVRKIGSNPSRKLNKRASISTSQRKRTRKIRK